MNEATVDQIKLATGYTVADYRVLEQEENVSEITRFIKKRFKERFIDPVDTTNTKHGFCTMAICCLLIETLVSFKEGWKDTKNYTEIETGGRIQRIKRTEAAFHRFLKEDISFKDIVIDPKDFYKGVRCGILHQGETTRGWRIHRRGPTIDSENKTINATKFIKALERSLNEYCRQLIRLPWDDRLWQNLRSKMNEVIRNCRKR